MAYFEATAPKAKACVSPLHAGEGENDHVDARQRLKGRDSMFANKPGLGGAGRGSGEHVAGLPHLQQGTASAPRMLLCPPGLLRREKGRAVEKTVEAVLRPCSEATLGPF